MTIGWHYFVYGDSVHCLKKNVNQYLESFSHLGSSCGAIINFHLLAASVNEVSDIPMHAMHTSLNL